MWYSRKRWKGERLWVWKFGDKWRINESKSSKATWNPETKVFTINLNIYSTNLRYSPQRSTESVGRALQEFFNTGKYLCVVSRSEGSRQHKGEFTTTAEWYSKLDELPEDSVMEKVLDVVVGSMEELICEAKVVETGITETYTAKEVEERWSRDMIYWIRRGEACGKTPVIKGRTWKEV